MPTVTKETTAKAWSYEGPSQNYPNGRLTDLGSYRNSYFSIAKPNAIRRAKPADLFANGTARVVSSEGLSCSNQFIKNLNGYTRGPVSMWGGVAGGPKSVSADLNRNYGSLRSKIKQENVNLAQALAEYKQTAQLFARLARDVSLVFHSLRSGTAMAEFFRTLRNPHNRRGRAIANRWLEYQYGWKPLMSDIYGSTDALVNQLRTGMWLYQRASNTQELSYSEKRSDSPVGTGGSVQYFDSMITKSVARYKISDTSLKTLTQVGITNPLNLVWELIPYSFVVDWLIPVGDYLQSLDALNGTSDLRVINSYIYTRSTVLVTKYGGVYRYWSKSVSRDAPTSNLPLPKLTYQPSESWTKVVNGIALLRQLRR